MSSFLARAIRWAVLAALALAAVSALSAHWITELWWFQELGYESVFWTRVLWPWGLRLLAGLLFTLLFYLNFRAMDDAIRRVLFRVQYRLPAISWSRVRWFTTLASLALGFLTSEVLPRHWELVARYLHRADFQVTDPLFGRDVGFFVFQLPFWRLVHTAAMQGLLLALLAAALVYGLTRAMELGQRQLYVEPGARRHLLLLGAALLVLKAADYRLQQYELVYSRRGVVVGAGYTDVSVVLPALGVMAGLCLLAALMLVLNIRRPAWRRVGLSLAGLVLASLVFLTLLPSWVQRFVVEPNELELERPFLERTIRMTRFGFDLDRIEEKDFPVHNDLRWEDLPQYEGTLANVRLWDWRPMLTSFRQLQEIRFYYSFPEIDVVRYRIDGQLRQVMTAARELDVRQVRNRTWINQHLQYTHGYGLIMSPVNESTAEGLPRFFLQDIPPRSAIPSLRVERPEIYYGELTDQYVLVGTRIPEFDYPLGDDNAWTQYQGRGGIPLNSLFRRGLFAVRERTAALILSNDLTPQTRILFRRNIHQRVRAIAPFLRYDSDPYMVLVDGRLYWIQDAYTTTYGVPYAQPVPGWGNYARNSVKVVIDAYDGTTTYYVFDDRDPLIKAWQGLYPDLFTPGRQMPPGLRDHVRYPEDLFLLQARTYAVYHMTNPTIFYNQEDVWTLAREIYQGTEQEMSPYYTILQLPDGEGPEMVLLLPYTPSQRNNMVAWLAARNDGDNYGRLMVYQFPKDQLVFGPMQIEARIDQDPGISEVLTLWNQSGSQVIRGNLLVLPVGRSLLYVKPIFLRAETGELPELVRVVVAMGPRLVMAPTWEDALAQLFQAPSGSSRSSAVPSRPEPPELPAAASDMGRLVRRALQVWEEGQQALRRGDWEAYGRAQRELETVLRELSQQVEPAGGTSPQPPPD